MSWVAIIAAILQVIGPILVEWLRKWLESRLHRAAESLGDMTAFSSEHEARDKMFDAAIKALPKRALARREFLRRCKTLCSHYGVTSAGPERAVPESELADVAVFAASASEE